MWDELKGLGGLLFFIGCIITWVSFLAPHINPTWISNPYQLWQWGILLVGAGIGVFVLAWTFSQIFKRRPTYYHIVRGKKITRRIAKLIVGGLVLTIIAWGLVTYGPEVWESIQIAMRGTPGGVPLYPGAELNEPAGIDWDVFWDYLLPVGWSGKNYKISAEIGAVADWYQTNMSDWNLENEITTMSSIKLIFTSDDDAAVIMVSTSFFTISGNSLVICSGPTTGLPYLTI